MKTRIIAFVATIIALVLTSFAGIYWHTQRQAQALLRIMHKLEAGKTTQEEVQRLTAANPSISSVPGSCVVDNRLKCAGWGVYNRMLFRLGWVYPAYFSVGVQTDGHVVTSWYANLSSGRYTDKPHPYIWVSERADCPCPKEPHNPNEVLHKFLISTTPLGPNIELTPQSSEKERRYAESFNTGLLTRSRWSTQPVQLLTSKEIKSGLIELDR